MTRQVFARWGLMVCLVMQCIAPPVLEAQEKQNDSKGSDTLLGDYITFAEVGLKVRQPKGFQKEKSFVGFGNEANKSSILLNKLPAPFGEASKGFTKENLEARGWTLHSREEIKLEEQPAVLIHFEQPLGGDVFEKWALLLGDEKKTLLITATFPQGSKKKLEPALKAAVLSTRIDDTAATKPQGNRILIPAKTAENAFQEVFVPACLESFAAETSF